jgi:hypothetical protein
MHTLTAVVACIFTNFNFICKAWVYYFLNFIKLKGVRINDGQWRKRKRGRSKDIILNFIKFREIRKLDER